MQVLYDSPAADNSKAKKMAGAVTSAFKAES
jgi:hypothetical protein